MRAYNHSSRAHEVHVAGPVNGTESPGRGDAGLRPDAPDAPDTGGPGLMVSTTHLLARLSTFSASFISHRCFHRILRIQSAQVPAGSRQPARAAIQVCTHCPARRHVRAVSLSRQERLKRPYPDATRGSALAVRSDYLGS